MVVINTDYRTVYNKLKIPTETIPLSCYLKKIIGFILTFLLANSCKNPVPINIVFNFTHCFLTVFCISNKRRLPPLPLGSLL